MPELLNSMSDSQFYKEGSREENVIIKMTQPHVSTNNILRDKKARIMLAKKSQNLTL